MLNKRFLHRMQVLSGSQALNGHDLATFILDGERETRIDTFSVNDHSTSTARTLVAALLSTGKLQAISKGIQKRNASFDFDGMVGSIDAENDGLNVLVWAWQAGFFLTAHVLVDARPSAPVVFDLRQSRTLKKSPAILEQSFAP